MWTLSRDNVITKPRHDIQNKMFMFTIVWNPSGFYVVNGLPNHIKMNRSYFVINLLIPIEQAIFPRGRAPHENNLWFISTIVLFTQIGFQQIGLKNTVFSACHINHIHIIWSLLTSTCFLQSKKKLERIQLADEDQFFECLQEVLMSLDQQELNTVFQAWMRRVQEVSEGNRYYVRW
jgi:hypothetical protein